MVFIVFKYWDQWMTKSAAVYSADTSPGDGGRRILSQKVGYDVLMDSNHKRL
jgi:hypothetical protein